MIAIKKMFRERPQWSHKVPFFNNTCPASRAGFLDACPVPSHKVSWSEGSCSGCHALGWPSWNSPSSGPSPPPPWSRVQLELTQGGHVCLLQPHSALSQGASRSGVYPIVPCAGRAAAPSVGGPMGPPWMIPGKYQVGPSAGPLLQ